MVEDINIPEAIATKYVKMGRIPDRVLVKSMHTTIEKGKPVVDSVSVIVTDENALIDWLEKEGAKELNPEIMKGVMSKDELVSKLALIGRAGYKLKATDLPVNPNCPGPRFMDMKDFKHEMEKTLGLLQPPKKSD